ncbi:MAG TPA: T9SS type A sorting domain-containing protein [Chitinophagales bacterium]|nr:T9SS type A sorting domain-containing protein [Chitinophagales bacterium]
MKKCSRILPCLVFFFSLLTNADAQITFEKNFASTSPDLEFPFHVTQTPDSGYVLFSMVYDSARSLANLKRLDAHGDLIWNRTIGLPGNTAVDASTPDPLIITPDGGYVFVAGAYNGFQTKRICVVKLNDAGDIVWSTFLNPDSSTINAFGAFFPFNAPNNSIGILGSYRPYAINEMMSILIDENGNVQSAKTFFLPYAHFFQNGVPAHDGIIFLIRETSDTSFLIGKMNFSGDIVWCKKLSSPFSSDLYFYSISEWSDHSIALMGVNNSPAPRRAILVHLDSVGHPVTSKEFGNDSLFDLYLWSTAINESGVLAASGGARYTFTHADIMLVRFDENSNVLDSHVYPLAPNNFGYGIHRAHDGFIFCGGTGSNPLDTIGAYLVKTDPEGHTGCDSSVTISFLGDILITDSVFNLALANLIMNDTSLTITGTLTYTETVLCEDIPDANFFDGGKNNGLMKVYPTLCSGLLTIEEDGSILGIGDLELFDLSGRKLMAAKLSGTETILNIEELHAGFYLLKISAGGGGMQLVKIFKR